MDWDCVILIGSLQSLIQPSTTQPNTTSIEAGPFGNTANEKSQKFHIYYYQKPTLLWSSAHMMAMEVVDDIPAIVLHARRKLTLTWQIKNCMQVLLEDNECGSLKPCLLHYLPAATPALPSVGCANSSSPSCPTHLAPAASSPTKELHPASQNTVDDQHPLNAQEAAGSPGMSLHLVGQFEFSTTAQFEFSTKAKVLTLIEDLHDLATSDDASALQMFKPAFKAAYQNITGLLTIYYNI